MKQSNLVILVVDSNREDMQIICKSLGEIRINRIICACDSREALQTLQADSKIDLMISSESTGYPELPGSSLVAVVKTLYPHVICVLTDDTKDPLAGLRAKAAGAADFVRKTGRFRENLGQVVPYLVNRVELFNKLCQLEL